MSITHIDDYSFIHNTTNGDVNIRKAGIQDGVDSEITVPMAVLEKFIKEKHK